ncbi:hypothetical protein ACFJIS_06160 [Variovorax boronicumulans]|uniref:hypothetical protein n=1 Tax=Variovorax boronicumulans TaxID=436515 RepID=UPI0036F239A7
MFIFEAAFQHEKRSGGIHSALKYHADVAEETRLYGPKEGAARREEGSRKPTRKERDEQEAFARPSFSSMRAVFDVNEHFIELSNPGGMARSLALMLFVVATVPGIYLIYLLVGDAFGILLGALQLTRDRLMSLRRHKADDLSQGFMMNESNLRSDTGRNLRTGPSPQF